MSKDVTKELIIALLVIFATILLVGVCLYDFMPNNKIVPEEITYATSQDIKEQLKSVEGFSADEVLMTYSLNQADLDNYQITNDYRPGKTNPFSTYVTQDEENSDNGSGNSSSGGTTSGGTSSGSSSGSSSSTTIDRSKPVKPGEVNPGNYSNNKGLK
ncbi:MAG: hypothetical protein IKF38_00375 [Clostridia bacterium]|nr:hypothetical protein [Clostridia bacterium]